MGKIYYHVSDADGRCGAAIVSKKYPDYEICAYNYWYDFNKSFSKVGPNEKIIFVDITPRIDQLLPLMELTKRITIIDHHDSSLRDLKKAGLEFPGIFEVDGLGAAALAWRYVSDKKMPIGVRLIARRDVWDRDNDVDAFHYGLKTMNTFPNSPIWDKILNDDIDFINRVLVRGRHVYNYLKPWYKGIIRSYAQHGMVDDYTAILCPQGMVESDLFDSIPDVFDIYIRATFSKDQMWHVSMTTNRDDIDVSVLANKHGGGGHRRASGNLLTELSDLFIPDKVQNLNKLIKRQR